MFEWPEQIQHLDLHDIRPYTKVSAAAFTACRANDLLSVPKLLKHYAEDTDFLTLRKATIIAREHLKKVCIWLLDHRDLLVRELAEPSADEIAPHHFSTRKLRFIDIKFRERYNTLFFRWPVAGLEVLFKGDYTYQKCHQIFF